ncbi:unnamed protein product [Miscanthus lutarioriparius]|uniref:Uncharacterized protein n=1 Tax=Miscanthus lutarioriparius TaxID=422564 RepID=A0A811NUX2_9POAL|nr:unnamed protein product [Miscanthus lutarioriparius]
MEDKRTKENTARVKELCVTSRKAKLVYSKVEDLNVEELSELLLDLSRVQREINDRLPPQQPSNQLENPSFTQQHSLKTMQASETSLPLTHFPFINGLHLFNLMGHILMLVWTESLLGRPWRY